MLINFPFGLAFCVILYAKCIGKIDSAAEKLSYVSLSMADISKMNAEELRSSIDELRENIVRFRDVFLTEGLKGKTDLHKLNSLYKQLITAERDIKLQEKTLSTLTDSDQVALNVSDKAYDKWNTLEDLVERQKRQLHSARKDFLREGNRKKKNIKSLKTLQRTIIQLQEELDTLEASTLA